MIQATKRPLNGQHISLVGARSRQERSAGAPRLLLVIGSSPVVTYTAEQIDNSLVADLKQRVEATTANVQVKIHNLPAWSDCNRWQLLLLLRDFGQRCMIRIGKVDFSDAFAAVKAAMVGTGDLDAHARSIRAACEAAALFHSDVVDAAAAQIKQRLDELGVAMRVATLARQIRAIVPRRENELQRDPNAAAGSFIQSLREQFKLAGDQVPLRYYRATFYVFNGRIWAGISEDFLASRVTAWLQKHDAPRLTSGLIRDILTNLQGMALVQCDAARDMPFWIADDGNLVAADKYIVVQNGIIDFNDLTAGGQVQLRPHDPRWFSDIILPFDYAADAECPKWKLFLDQVLAHCSEGDFRQEVLQAAAGNCLLPDNRFETMLILQGSGKNGKSVFLRVLSALLGDQNVEHIPFEQITREFRLASLIGKAANITMELNHLSKADEAMLRSLVSGEQITVNRKFLDPIKTRLHVKIFVATNDLPNFTDTTNATWRRVKIVPFTETIQVPNTQLTEELKEELPGIFNWAVEGLRRLISENQFPVCQRCSQVLAQLRTDSDPVREFVGQCLERACGGRPQSQPLYDVFRTWCMSRSRKPVAENEFGRRMLRLGIVKHRAPVQLDGSRPYFYQGWRFTTDSNWVVQRCISTLRPEWSAFPYVQNRTGAV